MAACSTPACIPSVTMSPVPVQIACALAAKGADVAEITREASAAAAALGSCGLATSVCCVPGAKPSTRHVSSLTYI